jgi:iron complex outermembrane receptor protein
MNDINCRRKFSDAITVDAGMSFYRLMSLNNNYITNYSENWYTIYSDVQFNLKRYIFNFSIQKYFLGKYNPVVQLSLGTNIRLSSILIIKANVSNKFRQPTFNEKYWIGLGNPDIKPEKGWGFDAGTEAVFNLTNISNKAVLTCYSNLIDDWIQWTPPSYIPRNYKQVWSRGIESSFEQSISIQKSKVHWSVKYNYTPTTTTKLENDNQSLLNKQLMLIPVHNLNGNISAEIKSFNTGMTLSYRGKRYNTNDESGPAMDSYALINLNFGKTFIYKLNRFLVDFKINNLFDKQYEMISAYPMPGRAFYISITFLLNQSN